MTDCDNPTCDAPDASTVTPDGILCSDCAAGLYRGLVEAGEIDPAPEGR